MAQRSPDIEERIIEGLSQGTPLAVLCREEGMPSDRAVRYWMEEDSDFASAIARARESGFDMIAAECLEIADDATNDYVEKKRADDSTYVAFDAEHVQRSKLRVETRLKLLAKWDPKRYGDLVKLAGADGKSPIAMLNLTADMTPAQAAEAYAALLG